MVAVVEASNSKGKATAFGDIGSSTATGDGFISFYIYDLLGNKTNSSDSTPEMYCIIALCGPRHDNHTIQCSLMYLQKYACQDELSTDRGCICREQLVIYIMCSSRYSIGL